MAMSQEVFDEIRASMGHHAQSRCQQLLRKHSADLAGARSEFGEPLLLCALQKNDALATAVLLEAGASLDAKEFPGSSRSVLQAAIEDKRPESSALQTAISFKKLLDDLPVEPLFISTWGSQIDGEATSRLANEIFEKIKATPEDGFVKLYHGSGERNLAFPENSRKRAMETQSVGIHQKSLGATLSTYPYASFFHGGLGWEIEIPRSLVKIDGEDKPNAIAFISSSNEYSLDVASIETMDKTIRFDQVKGRPVLGINAMSRSENESAFDDLDRPINNIKYELGEEAKQGLAQVAKLAKEQALAIDLRRSKEARPAISEPNDRIEPKALESIGVAGWRTRRMDPEPQKASGFKPN